MFITAFPNPPTPAPPNNSTVGGPHLNTLLSHPPTPNNDAGSPAIPFAEKILEAPLTFSAASLTLPTNPPRPVTLPARFNNEADSISLFILSLSFCVGPSPTSYLLGKGHL